MAIVEVHPNENLENALRRFKRRVQVEGIITDVKKRAFYLSPTEKKRIKSALARRRAMRASGSNCSTPPGRAGILMSHGRRWTGYGSLIRRIPNMRRCARNSHPACR